MPKRFVLKDTRTDEDVLGGPVTEDNAYVTLYGSPVNAGDKSPKELNVGESVLRRYSLSGSSGTYRLVRLEDGPAPGWA